MGVERMTRCCRQTNEKLIFRLDQGEDFDLCADCVRSLAKLLREYDLDQRHE